MTIADQITFAKRLARTTSNALTITHTDEAARFYVNQGVEEFCKNTHGLSKEDYLTVTPKFDTKTNFAIRLTIVGGGNALAATDVEITATDRTDESGTTVASDLQTAIQAAGAGTATVAWSTTEWKFTIDAGAGTTSITIGAPTTITYVDASKLLFGSTGTSSSTTYVGSFPEDSTLEVDLPTDFLEMEFVEWDQNKLTVAPFDIFMSPELFGDPVYYYIKDKKMRLSPVPNEQELLHIRYKHIPAPATLTGSSDSTTCSLNAEDHMAPVYYAAAKIAEENFEYQVANRHMANFFDQVTKYSTRNNNQNPKMFPQRVQYVKPRVEQT